jgi:glycoprotein-N-acetylgalactosamine 3-beta-galactosyltransferase
MTQPDHHESHARHVKATWGKRCNILFFVSSVVNDTLPSIAINATESREILWGKTKLGFQVNANNILKFCYNFLKTLEKLNLVILISYVAHVSFCHYPYLFATINP